MPYSERGNGCRKRSVKMGIKISGAELEIMEYLWESGRPGSFAELLEYFNEEQQKGWCKQTLNTNLLRLRKKGILASEKAEGRQLYTPAVTRKQYERMCAEELLEDFYDGKLQNLIAALAGGDKISKEEKEELLDYIDML